MSDDRSIWNKLHWFNFPDMVERMASDDEHIRERILPSIKFNDHNPTYIYMYNGTIQELTVINHSQETIDYLNEKGVTFYLNEPLCIYNNDDHTLIFYSEFNGLEDPETLRADELDSIRDYAYRNKLVNVQVKTCDYGCETYLPYYKNCLTLSCEDTFIKNANVANLFDDTFTNDLLGRASKDFTKYSICFL